MQIHPKSDVDRSYVPVKKWGRGLVFIKDCVELRIRGLKLYIHISDERLTQETWGGKIDGLEARTKEFIINKYLWLTKEVRSEKSWALLRNGNLKRDRESFNCRTEIAH